MIFSWSVVEKISVGLLNLHRIVHDIVLLKQKSSFEMFSNHFWTLSKKLPAFCPETFSWVFGTVFYLFMGSFWWKRVFLKKIFLTIFRHWPKNLRRDVEPVFHVTIETFFNEFFWWKLEVFSTFSDLEWIFFTCCREELSEVVKLAVTCPWVFFDEMEIFMKSVL